MDTADEQGLDRVALPDLQFFPTAAEDKLIKRNKDKKKKQRHAVLATTETRGIKRKQVELEKVKLPSKKGKMFYQEYLKNIEDTQDDYTLLWSYGTLQKRAN